MGITASVGFIMPVVADMGRDDIHDVNEGLTATFVSLSTSESPETNTTAEGTTEHTMKVDVAGDDMGTGDTGASISTGTSTNSSTAANNSCGSDIFPAAALDGESVTAELEREFGGSSDSDTIDSTTSGTTQELQTIGENPRHDLFEVGSGEAMLIASVAPGPWVLPGHPVSGHRGIQIFTNDGHEFWFPERILQQQSYLFYTLLDQVPTWAKHKTILLGGDFGKEFRYALSKMDTNTVQGWVDMDHTHFFTTFVKTWMLAKLVDVRGLERELIDLVLGDLQGNPYTGRPAVQAIWDTDDFVKAANLAWEHTPPGSPPRRMLADILGSYAHVFHLDITEDTPLPPQMVMMAHLASIRRQRRHVAYPQQWVDMELAELRGGDPFGQDMADWAFEFADEYEERARGTSLLKAVDYHGFLDEAPVTYARVVCQDDDSFTKFVVNKWM